MRRLLIMAFMGLALASCDNPQTMVDKLRAEIAAFKSVPTDSAQAQIEVDFTQLEIQIQRLQEKGKTAEAAAYRKTAENLSADYRAARMVAAMKNAQSAIEGLGHAFKEAGQSIGDALRDPASPTPINK